MIGCNGVGLVTVKTEREAKRLCQVEVGLTLKFDIRRGGSPLELSIVAEPRPGL